MSKALIFLLVLAAGCDLIPEVRELKEEKAKAAWEGPCKETVVKKEKLIHMTCTNKNHKLVVEGDFVICRCEKEK